jgi:copper chaperone
MCSTDQSTRDLGLTDKNHACTCSADNHDGNHSDNAGDHSHHHSDNTDQLGSDVVREHYLVEGMTCSHCVAGVTEEVSAIDGVESVSIDLNAGGASRIMVVSSKPVPVDDIRTAVTEAGYSLVTA